MTDDPDLVLDRQIAARLPRTWSAFFQRFGRLTPPQRQAMPLLLDGRDILLCAPTATGKTEAACAPLIEHRLARGIAWTLLYVSPTRALVNDLYERLWPAVHQLGLRIERRTGDHHGTVHPPPQVLITTPESFDSLLCRGGRGETHALTGVDAVILDEIHLLHGTARGEQLRWLLERLRRLRRQAKQRQWIAIDTLQVVALSATLPDADAVVAAYLQAGVAVHVGGGREIESVSVDSDSPALEVALLRYLQGLKRPEKVLVFSNARRRVDTLAAHLRPALEGLGYEVEAHHGSLARQRREAAEARMRQARAIVLFATSTLEIGVDIGDVDLVVLDGPAPNVPALLQRIGRGNRRTGKTRLMACAGSQGEIIVHSAMIEAARAGDLGPAERGPHYAVARQQLASYIAQAPQRSRSPSLLTTFLTTVGGEAANLAPLVDHLVAIGELSRDPAGVRLGSDWLDHAATGQIHSNIEGSPGVSVVDEDSGELIAHGVRFDRGSGLRIGGQLLQARRWAEQKLEVRRVADPQLADGEWSYTSRAWVLGAGQPYAVRRYLGIEDDHWPTLALPHGTCVFHFGGTRRKVALQLIAERQGSRLTANAWFLVLSAGIHDKPAWLSEATLGLLEMRLPGQTAQLERALGRPRANALLPDGLRLDEVRRWLDLESELPCIVRSRWEPVADGDTAIALRAVAAEVERQRSRRGPQS